jgi:hypothetical protein
MLAYNKKSVRGILEDFESTKPTFHDVRGVPSHQATTLSDMFVDQAKEMGIEIVSPEYDSDARSLVLRRSVA